MYRIDVIIFFLLAWCKAEIIGQSCTDETVNLMESFVELSDYREFKLQYLKEKETLYLSVFENKVQKSGYRLLIKDIHPEGVFLEKAKIRVLTINNGHLFVEEEFRSGKRLSHNTNYIDIEGFVNLEKARKFIEALRTFVKSKTNKSKTKDEEIKVYMSPWNN